MQPKEYQQQAVDRFDVYLDELLAAQAAYEKAAKLKEEHPDINFELPHFPEVAWNRLQERGEVGRPHAYSRRHDGIGRPVPNVTLKVPTAGGKTFLASACAAKLVNRYWQRNTGIVLWIVPNEAIYTQTKKQLADREHPYRQMLDRAAAGRVKILEKDTPLHAADVEAHLCVMLLMLASANRDAKDQLRLFRDRGNVNGFLPNEGDIEAHQALVRAIPNLDYYTGLQFDTEGGGSVGVIRSSLGNALRLSRPIVIMDEGHKAFSRLAYDTLYGFNPSFVLELSATPRDGTERWSNWLTNIPGRDLEREEMIKMPIEVTVQSSPEWRDCLRDAWQQTESLRKEAERLRADTLRYIRPILLVQVERTGKDAHEAGKIHADDAVEYLKSIGVPEDAIAIKTSEQNDLKDPEKQNLLEPGNPVRVIITKQALQEGWDCPFAYVLCTLAANRNQAAMTQLVGRILRQPEAKRTQVEALDRCYVFCNQAETKAVLDSIKSGLEQDGMGDLIGRVVERSSSVSMKAIRKRRQQWQGVTYYLPEVLVREGADRLRPLDWECDILGAIDWDGISTAQQIKGLPKGESRAGVSHATVTLDILKDGATKAFDAAGPPAAFDAVFASRAISTEVPNPFAAWRIVQECVSALRDEGWTEAELGGHQQYLIDAITLRLRGTHGSPGAVDAAARAIFEEGLAEQRILFKLTATKWDWQVPHEDAIPQDARFIHRQDDGLAWERSLMDGVVDAELNGLELKAACFLDRQSAVRWWYRNVVLASGYSLQGWRRNRVYPDFIVLATVDGTVERWLVLETKGDQLAGNLDTSYKRELLEKLTEAFAEQSDLDLGQLTILQDERELTCRLVMQDGYEQEIALALQPAG